jgi:YegS/Rv2252/BmrU family lipid kinase
MGKRIVAIIYSRAASYRAGRKWRQLRQDLADKGFEVTARFTERKFHAVDLARDAADRAADIVLSVGGDGTLNEVVNGLMTLSRPPERRPALGILSLGTGSDFARTLGLIDTRSAVRALIHGTPRICDLGHVRFTLGSRTWIRYFANVFDVGLGGNVVRIANSMPKNLGGFMTFLLSSLGGIATFKPPDLIIEIDGNHIDRGSITIAGCANGQYFGGGMNIAPMARLDDGRLEVLYVKDTNLFKFIRRVLMPVYQAGHLSYERFYHRPARRVRITGDRVFLCDIDGEEEKAEAVEIKIVGGAVRIMMMPPTRSSITRKKPEKLR